MDQPPAPQDHDQDDTVETPRSGAQSKPVRSQFAKELEPKVDKILENRIEAHISQSYSGPLPAADQFARYEQTLPGAANRILTLAEDEAKHRRELESKANQAQIDDLIAQRNETRIGQILAFLICVFIFSLGSTLIYLGHDWAGGTLVTGTVGGLAYVFVKGHAAEMRDHDEDE